MYICILWIIIFPFFDKKETNVILKWHLCSLTVLEAGSPFCFWCFQRAALCFRMAHCCYTFHCDTPFSQARKVQKQKEWTFSGVSLIRTLILIISPKKPLLYVCVRKSLIANWKLMNYIMFFSNINTRKYVLESGGYWVWNSGNSVIEQPPVDSREKYLVMPKALSVGSLRWFLEKGYTVHR